MGRNIWQSDYPVAMIKAVKAIVHQNATVKEAHEIFKKLKGADKQEKPVKPVIKTKKS